MFRQLFVILLVFVLLLGTVSCASTKPNRVADLENVTLWFRYQAEEVDSIENATGQLMPPMPGEHFVIVVADMIHGDPQQLAFTLPTAIARKSFLGYNYGEYVLVSPEQIRTTPSAQQGQLLVAWFYRLPKDTWPLRLVFANGVNINITHK
jgi:hypothetical protein